MNVARMIVDAVRAEVARQRPAPTVLWGTVATVTPLTVTFAGDVTAVPVPLISAGLSPGPGDRVVLTRVGAAWAATDVLVES